MIHVYLKTIEGKLYTLVLDKKIPLAKLIEVIMETTEILREDLRLVFRQRQLTDVDEKTTLEDCGIEDHSVIHVVKRWKRCSCASNAECV